MTYDLLSAVHHLDVSVYTFLNSFAGDPLLDRIVAEEEGNNLLKGGVFMALYWREWFRPGPQQDDRRRSIVAIIFGTLGIIAVARLLASMFPFRLRPMFDPLITHIPFAVPIAPNMENWSAFPSDTAAYFFALAFGMFFLRRRTAIALTLFAAVWICLPRLYIGLHFLTDIAAGAVLAAMGVVVALRSNWMRRTAAFIVQLSETRPAGFYAVAFLLSIEMAYLFDTVRGLVHSISRALSTGPHHHTVALLVTFLTIGLGLAVIGHTLKAKRSARRGLAI